MLLQVVLMLNYYKLKEMLKTLEKERDEINSNKNLKYGAKFLNYLELNAKIELLEEILSGV